MKYVSVSLSIILLSLFPNPGHSVDVRPAAPEIRSVTGKQSSLDKRKGPVVYTSKSDTRFHSIECPRLKEPEASFPLDDAMRAGYGPCPRCSREVLETTPRSTPPRRSRRVYASRSGLISGGPPYIAIVRPKHRVVSTFPRIGY